MDNTEAQDTLTPEQQLAELAKQQQQLQQKIDQTRADNVAKQMNALSNKAQARIAAEAQEALVLAEIRKNRQEREAEAQREAEVIAEANRKATEERMAQQLLEKNARIQAEVTAQLLRDETEKAHRLERELERQLLDLRDTTVVAECTKQATEIPSPLARILFPDASNAQTTAYEGLTSEQNARLVAKRDAVENLLEFGKSKAVFQTAQPTPDPTPVRTNRKAKHYVDTNVSRQLETLIRTELKMSPNTQRLDEMSAQWEEAPLVSAVRDVIAQAKVRPMSHDGFLGAIEQLLEEAERATA